MNKFSILVGLMLLTSCSNNVGREARPDAYDEGLVNHLQVIRIVEIKHISKSYMVEDSKHAPAPVRKNHTGSLVAIALLPLDLSSTLITGRSVTGQDSHDGEFVNAVGIDYIDRFYKDSPLLRSTQVGKVCEYKNGFAELVKTESGETRIQPNSHC